MIRVLTSLINHLVVVEEEKICDTVGGLDYLESPVSDGTIEENFEEELVNAPISSYNSIYSFRENEDEDEDFSDVSQYGIVEVVGDDAYGRKIITVTACKLPNSNQLDHQRLLRLACLVLEHGFFLRNKYVTRIRLLLVLFSICSCFIERPSYIRFFCNISHFQV